MNMRKWMPYRIMAGMLVFALLAGNAYGQRYAPTDDGSKVQFRVVNHLFVSSTVNGYFKGLKGTIVFDPNNPAAASMDVTVSVATISTGIGLRDKDLKKEDYFNASKFPVIRVLSTAVAKTNKPGTYLLTATLTMKGVAKSISFPFTAMVSGNGCMFKANFAVNRTSFGVGDTKKIDEQVNVMLQVFAKKQ